MKILLIEDDTRLSGLIQRGLRRDGHAVDPAGSIEDGAGRPRSLRTTW